MHDAEKLQPVQRVVTGHDGRMGTYAALVLASAACQAWLQRGRPPVKVRRD